MGVYPLRSHRCPSQFEKEALCSLLHKPRETLIWARSPAAKHRAEEAGRIFTTNRRQNRPERLQSPEWHLTKLVTTYTEHQII